MFVIDTLEVGGTEISLVETVHLFNKIEPIVCHIYLGDTLKNRLTEKGIKVYSLNIHENFGFYKAYKSLRHIINTEKPHLIVPYLFRSELVSRIAGKTTKLLLLVRSLMICQTNITVKNTA